MRQAPRNNNDGEKRRLVGVSPIGTLESRVAARAECERRERILDDSAVVVIMTRLPRMFDQELPIVIPPDSLSQYKMPDGSTVDVIRRHWGEPHTRGVTIFVEQTWHDRGIYHGDRLMKSLEEVRHVGRPMI